MAAAFGIVPLIGLGLNRIFAGATQGNAAKWAVAGKSLGIYSAMFALMWAMPFIRNYITAQRTGKIEFASVIGGGENNRDAASVEKAKKDYMRKTLAILGLGAAGTLAAIIGGKAAAAKNLGMGKTISTIVEKAGLKNGSFGDFNGLRAVLFWGVPAYAGWIHASRDGFEVKEQLLKFGAFVFSFLVPQKLMDKFYTGKFETLLGKGVDATYKNITQKLTGEARKTAIKHWTRKNLLGLASSIVLLGTLPAALNIILTKKRMANRQGQPAAPAIPADNSRISLPSGNLQPKPFEQWAQRPNATPVGAFASPLPSA